MRRHTFIFFALIANCGFSLAGEVSDNEWFRSLPRDGAQVQVSDSSILPDQCRELVEKDFPKPREKQFTFLKAWRADREVFVSAETKGVAVSTHLYKCNRRKAAPVYFSVLDTTGRTTARQQLWSTVWDKSKMQLTSEICSDAPPHNCTRTVYKFIEGEFWLNLIETQEFGADFKVRWQAWPVK